MKTILAVLLVFSALSFSQFTPDNLPGSIQIYQSSGGFMQTKSIILNEPAGNYYIPNPSAVSFTDNNSAIRWSFIDPIAIGDRCAASSNGLYQAVGWALNTERISLYNNLSSTPLWEYSTNPNTGINNVAVSDTGGYIVSGSYHNILVFSRSSAVPVFDFNLETALPDTGVAGPVDITGDGNFIIACASRQDSSWIFGFNRTSTNWVWRYRVGQTNNTGGAGIQGVKMSGNDSVVIVNTYLGFYVFKTYTGQLLFQGTVNPISNSGTQFPQAISGNGDLIATINYSGNLRVYQWNGSTYNFLWQHSESGQWMTAVDISFDGSLVSCGTLNFLGGSNYDGKVKLLRSTSSTPVWTYSGCGDQVTCVSFSKDGRILAASTYGDLGNVNNDLLVFKTSVLAPAPIFAVNSPGSFFWCSASANGSTIITSGKKVHARTFGNGGEAYNIFIDTADVPLSIGNQSSIPEEYRLHQNYPNPFNPSTQIRYDLLKDGFVNISVFDVLGRKVSTLADEFQRSGKYSVVFNAEGLSSGVYYYKIISGDFKDTKKLILIK